MSRNARNEKDSENSPKFGDEKQKVPVEGGDFGENGEHGDESGKHSPIESVNKNLNDMAKRPFESGAWFCRKWRFWRKILKALPTSQIKRQRVLFESSDLGEKSVRPYLQVDWNGKEALWKWRFWRLEIEARVAVVSLSFIKWASTPRFSPWLNIQRKLERRLRRLKEKGLLFLILSVSKGLTFTHLSH